MEASVSNEQIAELVYAAIDVVNAEQPEGSHLPKARQTVLSGKSATLDSLGLVNLIVAVEEQLASEVGLCITLFDMKATRRTNNPFHTVASLVEYVQEMVAAR